MKPGAFYKNGTTTFNIWAPKAETLHLLFSDGNLISMEPAGRGWWTIQLDNIKPGALYKYKINNGGAFADPASFFQPKGVHDYSTVVEHSNFIWEDENFIPQKIEDIIIYEIHTGTYTSEGTFKAIVNHLEELKELGITAIEIMPVAQFPGERNWGYDGVYHYAPQNSYGTPDDLKYLINEAHKKDLSVFLDIVYNHFGPEGNYVNQFGEYFNPRYKTPWGDAINYDNSLSDEVRNFFINNALYWLDFYHFDGLRLDAVHSIYDQRAKHFLLVLNEEVKSLGKKNNKEYLIMAESDLNDIKFVKDKSSGGFECSAVWSDDFHHSVHAFFTKEKSGYYEDFGNINDIIKALNHSFVYDGVYSNHRKQTHGMSAGDVNGKHFIICSQNHDQVGNRAFGERLTNLVEFEKLKLIASITILAPYIPLLFMGEEYAEENPFQYFISHGDEHLIKAVREGRKKEFESFNWKGEIPDPFSTETYNNSKLNHEIKSSGKHKVMRLYYKELINTRKKFIRAHNFERENFFFNKINENVILYSVKDGSLFALFNLSGEEQICTYEHSLKEYSKILDSNSGKWMGNGESAPEHLSAQNSKIKISGYTAAVYSVR